MNCPVCGAPLEDGAKFCTECGAKLGGEVKAAAPAAPEIPVKPEKPVRPERPERPEKPAGDPEIQKKYRPIKPWGYFGLEILFAIPVVGFVALLIFTFAAKNVNRRNFARSYWCGLLVFLILAAVLAAVGFATGYAQQAIAEFQKILASA